MHSPSLSELQFAPGSAVQDAGGGSVVVAGSFKFSDAGGDLMSFTLSAQYADGSPAGAFTLPLSGAAGVTAGVIQFYLRVPSGMATTFLLEVSTADQQGAQSNTLAQTFCIEGSTSLKTTRESKALPMTENTTERPLVSFLGSQVSTSADLRTTVPPSVQETM